MPMPRTALKQPRPSETRVAGAASERSANCWIDSLVKDKRGQVLPFARPLCAAAGEKGMAGRHKHTPPADTHCGRPGSTRSGSGRGVRLASGKKQDLTLSSRWHCEGARTSLAASPVASPTTTATVGAGQQPHQHAAAIVQGPGSSQSATSLISTRRGPQSTGSARCTISQDCFPAFEFRGYALAASRTLALGRTSARRACAGALPLRQASGHAVPGA